MLKNISIHDSELISKIALEHSKAPLNWNKNYSYTTEEVNQDIERIKNFLKSKKAIILADLLNNELKGFIWGEIADNNLNQLEIISLWVDKENRQQGIASNLKIELEKYCKQNQIRTITTSVFANNHKMLNLNKKLGYEIVYHKMKKKL